MKKLLLCVACGLAGIISVQAQTLYGITYRGGNAGGGGTIYKFIPATNELTVVKSFEGNAPASPYDNLIPANNGKLYGLSSDGGNGNSGAIFSYDPSTHTFKLEESFDYGSGARPVGSLVQASDGKLYGMAREGGSDLAGVLFSFDPATSTFKKLRDFGEFALPEGTLTQAADGKLYGSSGGPNGSIFSFDPATSAYTEFNHVYDTLGGVPAGKLILLGDGKLYGITTGGGQWSAGVIFSFDPSTAVVTKLKEFDTTGGALPQSGLLAASDGKLYGTTFWGGAHNAGVIFSFDPVSSAYVKLKDFEAVQFNDTFSNYSGGYPRGRLMQAGDGKLYGMTWAGGAGNAGVLFSFDPVSSAYTKLKDFDRMNADGNFEGSRPYGGLMQTGDGKLYGMTTYGGSRDLGVLFSFDPQTVKYTKLKDFGTNDGGDITAPLVRAGNGKLYGVTSRGGNHNYGVIFSFDPASSAYTMLKDFNGNDGRNPRGLTQAVDGKLYGMTFLGGTAQPCEEGDLCEGWGVLFSFDPATSAYTKLHDFDGANGFNPWGRLVQANNGKLYGMARGSQRGILFSFDPLTSTYIKVKEFSDQEIGDAEGSLIQGDDGKLYGFGTQGDNYSGVIFSFDPSTSVYTKLKEFDCEGRCFPHGTLMQARDGKLYSTTGEGHEGIGAIFSFDPSTAAYTNLYKFNGQDGNTPTGNLLQASDGKLYGMTELGGSNNKGVVFSFDPSSSTYTKLQDFNGDNGANPYRNSAFIEVIDTLNTPPTVNFTIPVNNAAYLAGGNVYLAAMAKDADGTISKVEFYNGSTLLHTATDTPYAFKWQKVRSGNYTLTARATDNTGLVTTSAEVNISVVPNKPPTVNIINPANNQVFLKGGTIHLKAAAKDPDGRITKVEFFNGTTLLATERKLPYTFDWKKLPAGNYMVTAKATDNWGAETISAVVNLSVVVNREPSVSLINPANGEGFTSPATINVEAAALDPDGRIVKVDFYNGATLLATERKTPYTYQWQNVPAGDYTLTAVAQDNWGAVTTSAPVTVTVSLAGEPLVSSRSAANITSGMSEKISLRLLPNPAKNILNVHTAGIPKNERVTVSIISASGGLLQTKQFNSVTPLLKMNVSSLNSGVYFLKIVSGTQVMYRQFVKL